MLQQPNKQVLVKTDLPKLPYVPEVAVAPCKIIEGLRTDEIVTASKAAINAMLRMQVISDQHKGILKLAG